MSKAVTQKELHRAFDMAMRNPKSSGTLAFHRAIAKRLDAGAKVEQPGSFKARAYKDANGAFGLYVERIFTANPGSQLILAMQLIEQELSLLQSVREKIRREVERAFLKGVDRRHLGEKARPAHVETGKSTATEREYVKRLKKSGYESTLPKAKPGRRGNGVER